MIAACARPPRWDGPWLFFFVGLVLLAARIVAGCSSATVVAAKERTAEATYLAEQLRCVDAEPALRFDAPQEQRRAANARIDACRETTRARWGRSRDGGAR